MRKQPSGILLNRLLIAKLNYQVSEDKMQAFVTIGKPSNGGREMDFEDVKEIA